MSPHNTDEIGSNIIILLLLYEYKLPKTINMCEHNSLDVA